MCSVAVVIPCYNGWKYIEKCLKAIEEQTYQIDEIIIVDDCSSDDSYERLILYSQTSNLNIKVLQNSQNVGPGESRRNALSLVTSDYVAFCDCDDWYELDFMETVKRELKESSADLIIFDSYTAFNNGIRKIDHITTHLKDKNQEFILAHYPMSLCRFVVKSGLISLVRHTNLRHAEDGVIASQLISISNGIRIIDKPLYNYYFREDSASKKPSKETCFDLMKAFEFINDTVDDRYGKEVEFIGINYVCYGSVLCGLKSGVKKSDVLKIVTSFESNYPNWYVNVYYKDLGRAKKIFLWCVKNRLFLFLWILAKIHPLVVKLKRKK